jgi:DNA-binding response OmpR family regulator
MSAHVLLIEDDGALRLEMLDYLIRHHMRVTACGTLAEAKEALVPGANTFGRPDVVVADISLPDGDGASFYVENAGRFPEAKGTG